MNIKWTKRHYMFFLRESVGWMDIIIESLYGRNFGNWSLLGAMALMKCLHQHWCLVVADQCSDGILGRFIFNLRDPKNMAKFRNPFDFARVVFFIPGICNYTKPKPQRPFYFHCLVHRDAKVSMNPVRPLSSWSRSSVIDDMLQDNSSHNRRSCRQPCYLNDEQTANYPPWN